MSQEEILSVARLLLQYMIPTLKVFGATVLFSLPLGMVVSLLKMCKCRPVNWLTSFYILIMRGTPLMLQIIAIYYAIPYLKLNTGLPQILQALLSHVDIKSESYMFEAVIVAFTLNYTAYFAEIFRGGIESIPKGQYEAAACLGMTKSQTFLRIILPQVIKRVLPASANEIITLVKDTSLANVIAYAEITLKAKQQMQLYSSLVPLFLAGLFYLIMTMVLTGIFALLEKKLSYYK
jgi:polar amino acid transport system permease protein